LRHALDDFRVRISYAEALPQLSLLGILCGLLAGLVIIVFRLTIETAQSGFLPAADPENYEALSPLVRLILPVAGGLIIGVLFQFTSEAGRRVGVVHVMERLAYHQGRLPLRNAVMQFAGAAISIIAGHSVGREGPSIHLGAASSSLAGQWAHLPNNSLRVLTGCGVAAAIAASFNTPLAGVIFAMEVVMMEYTVAGFAPVILAAVSATALTRLVYGSAPAFSVPSINLSSLYELPYILAMGLIIGTLAAVFIKLLRFFATRTKALPLWLRTTLAGLVVGLCALVTPEIMGIGYDTVNGALLGKLGIGLLLTIIGFKLLATTAGLGLGLPGGLIGPVLFLGAMAGGVLGVIGQWWAPTDASSPGFYALIGMGAMMAGVLHAPLAALMAMLELTANPNIILPGMLAVIAAVITCRQLFRQPSVFLTLMREHGLDYRNDPISQSLRRIGVGGVMDRNVATLPRHVDRERVMAELAHNPRWILVRDEDKTVALMPAVDLVRETKDNADINEFDLLALPADRRQVSPIDLQATLQEADQVLEVTGSEALYVCRPSAHGIERVYGVLMRADIERNYRL